MFCTKCGAAVAEGAIYCSACGTRIGGGCNADSAQGPTTRRRVRVRWWWFLIAFIIVVAICQIIKGPVPQEQYGENVETQRETVSTNSATWKDVARSVREIRKAKADLDQSWSDLKKEMSTACDEVRKSPEYAEYEKSKDQVKKTWAEVKAEFKKGLDEGSK